MRVLVVLAHPVRESFAHAVCASAVTGFARAGHEVRVLDGALPLAYCVPGREPRVVLSDGVLQTLDREQVDAVLAHERAHLRHRHELPGVVAVVQVSIENGHVMRERLRMAP